MRSLSRPILIAGLATLSGLKSLKKVYLWQSKATAEGARQLQEQVPAMRSAPTPSVLAC